MEAPAPAATQRAIEGSVRERDRLPRIVVLASGTGSNLQALLDAAVDGRLDARVVGVVTNRRDALAIERARRAGVASDVVAPEPAEPREAYDARLARAVAAHRPDLVVLAGWMRILTLAFLDRFPGRVLNLHPALPGELPGTRAIERAHAEFLDGRRTRTGVMVHLVPDEGVDVGPVLASVEVPIMPGDTVDALAARVHAAEHDLLVRTVAAHVSTLAAGQPHPIPSPAPTEVHG